jgi:hypothetical protein
MRLKLKHSIQFKVLVFFLMIGLMVVLNNRHDVSKESKDQKTETVSNANIDHSGITPLFAQVPQSTEGTLPIQLVSNPFTNFLIFVNHSQQFRTAVQLLQRKKIYIDFCTLLPASFLIEYLSTARNKGHR